MVNLTAKQIRRLKRVPLYRGLRVTTGNLPHRFTAKVTDVDRFGYVYVDDHYPHNPGTHRKWYIDLLHTDGLIKAYQYILLRVNAYDSIYMGDMLYRAVMGTQTQEDVDWVVDNLPVK